MNRRGRSIVLAISIPIVVFAAVGGFMSTRHGRARREQLPAPPHLRGCRLADHRTTTSRKWTSNKVMHGAMHGLADGLDPDTAYLDINQVGQYEKNEPLASGADRH